MVHICELKRKCRIVCTTANVLCLGLLFIVVFVATIDVIEVDAIECGTVNLYHDAILGGNEVRKDEWPFIAALYYTSTSKYFCGGTIVSHKHVLTAAHCIQTKGKGVPHIPGEITVRLGAYNLTDTSEKDVVERNVEQIFVHPDWNVNDEKYDADIAVLVLNESVTLSNQIRPVCMPWSDFLIDGLTGTVVGWGKTENGTAEGIPRKIEVNALNDTYCYETDKGIASYASERSFCGEGSGTPNKGDSGGGFFAVAGSGWVQFGTVSFIRPEATGNLLKFALYMKLTSLRDWIAQRVEQSGGNISLASTKANMNCTYRYSKHLSYGCWLFDLNIRQENFVVNNITGSHDLHKNNDDVEGIVFKTGVVASIPRNFGNIFRNLKFLEVSVNTRRVSRSNFQNLEGLETIGFVDSGIAEFDEDSLWDLPNLQSFDLRNSELKVLHAAIFSRNHKLMTVKVSSNALLKSLPRYLFENNLLLDHVSFDDNSIEIIDERIFETNAKLRVVSLMGNRLRHLSENLFRNNVELKVINLGKNRIKTIDERSFKANSKLLFLTLDSNELEFLPALLLQGLEFLETIYLDEQFFETNMRIQKISLKSNQLTRLPANLFRNNRRLQGVHLGSNYIDEIDENLFVENLLLQIVDLEYNFLVELPWNLFKQNTMLEFVNAQWNLLETIDERTFAWNTRLWLIHFNDNHVRFLPGKIFQNNSELEVVHFDGNSLETLDEHTFQANGNLQGVFLDRNNIDYIPENLFRNNSLLEIVDLSTNSFKSGRLQSLPKNLFRDNPRLRTIDLHSNSLKFIETNFTMLNNVNFINLSGNVCIDKVFYGGDIPDHFQNVTRWPTWTKNLTEFQEFVTANCS